MRWALRVYADVVVMPVLVASCLVVGVWVDPESA
jgi:hypothetical protein